MNILRKATMVALSAAAVGGIALASPAQAAPAQADAYLGFVTFDGGTRDDARGLSTCEVSYPGTTSATFVGIGGEGRVHYNCYD